MKILLSRIWLYLSSSPIYVDRQSIFEYFSMMTWILRKRNQGVSNITRVDLWSSYYLIGPTSRAHNCSCATEKKALYYNTWATAAFWCVTKSFTWYFPLCNHVTIFTMSLVFKRSLIIMLYINVIMFIIYFSWWDMDFRTIQHVWPGILYRSYWL